MDLWQRSLRRIHQIGEILDLDPTRSDMIADFVALIEAMREGLNQIDDDFRIPDSQINTLFLSKLKARPDWNDWATTMLRDSRLNAANPDDRMTFHELAGLALKREKVMTGELPPTPRDQDSANINGSNGIAGDNSAGEPHAITTDTHTPARSASAPKTKSRPRALTQDEINAFVVDKMNHDGKYLHRSGSVKGHAKRPSQEEINAYVVHQMRRELDHSQRKSGNRTRSQSLPERMQSKHSASKSSSSASRCTHCGDAHHHQPGECWRRWRVAAEAPQANFAGKRVEFKTQVPGKPPMYRTGFAIL